jgi:hypothetical protein
VSRGRHSERSGRPVERGLGGRRRPRWRARAPTALTLPAAGRTGWGCPAHAASAGRPASSGRPGGDNVSRFSAEQPQLLRLPERPVGAGALMPPQVQRHSRLAWRSFPTESTAPRRRPGGSGPPPLVLPPAASVVNSSAWRQACASRCRRAPRWPRPSACECRRRSARERWRRRRGPLRSPAMVAGEVVQVVVVSQGVGPAVGVGAQGALYGVGNHGRGGGAEELAGPEAVGIPARNSANFGPLSRSVPPCRPRTRTRTPSEASRS